MARREGSIARVRRSLAGGGIALLLVAGALGGARAEPRGVASDVVRLVLRLEERRLYVVRDGTEERLASFPVAVGRTGYETPTGRFRVLEKIEDPDFVQFDWENPSTVIGRVAPGPANPLGARWIGFTSAHGWGIGFHGTPHPELLGRAVSHGCVRMRNADVVELYDRVAIGTPVVVEP